MITENKIDKRNYSWIDVYDPSAEELERLNSEYKLPEHLIQDCMKPEHLPKYEATDAGHFLMTRCYDRKSRPDSITIQGMTRKIALFITQDKIITIHRQRLDIITDFATTCEKQGSPQTLPGLIYAFVKEIISSYGEPINKLQDLYDQLESDVLSKKVKTLGSQRIYQFRRRMFVIKRTLNLTSSALFQSKELWEERPSMMQDLKEHIDHLYFQLDELSDNFEFLFSLYVSLQDQKSNQVMKVLTVYSSILLPLNFIASFYGMNFDYLPGLHSPIGLEMIIGFMVLMSILTMGYFKYKGWFRGQKV